MHVTKTNMFQVSTFNLIKFQRSVSLPSWPFAFALVLGLIALALVCMLIPLSLPCWSFAFALDLGLLVSQKIMKIGFQTSLYAKCGVTLLLKLGRSNSFPDFKRRRSNSFPDFKKHEDLKSQYQVIVFQMSPRTIPASIITHHVWSS